MTQLNIVHYFTTGLCYTTVKEATILTHPIRHTPTVGSVSKKVMAINPNLNAPEIIAIIRQSVLYECAITDGFTKTEVIDEVLALNLARASLIDSACGAVKQ